MSELKIDLAAQKCPARAARITNRQISNFSFPIRHWRQGGRGRILLLRRWSAAAMSIRLFLLTEGAVAVIAAIASYLWGYLDGRAEVRAQWKKTFSEMRDFE